MEIAGGETCLGHIVERYGVVGGFRYLFTGLVPARAQKMHSAAAKRPANFRTCEHAAAQLFLQAYKPFLKGLQNGKSSALLLLLLGGDLREQILWGFAYASQWGKDDETGVHKFCALNP
jgi:hypothetical protein